MNAVRIQQLTPYLELATFVIAWMVGIALAVTGREMSGPPATTSGSVAANEAGDAPPLVTGPQYEGPLPEHRVEVQVGR